MTNTVEVRPLRTFEGEEGFKTPDSAPFRVTSQRAADLKANGLVEIVEPEHKKAPEHENKMAPEPQNKGTDGPVTESAPADEAKPAARAAKK